MSNDLIPERGDILNPSYLGTELKNRVVSTDSGPRGQEAPR